MIGRGVRDALRREAERALADLVSRDVLRELLDPVGRFDERYWRHCRDQGWTAIGIPEERGGIGLGLAEICTLAEVAGGFAVGAPFLESSLAAAQALLRHDDDAARAGLAAGRPIVPPRKPTRCWQRPRLRKRLGQRVVPRRSGRLHDRDDACAGSDCFA